MKINTPDIENPVFKHPRFDERRINTIHQIVGLLYEVYPLEADEWEDNLRMDANPDSELRLWLHVGKCYAEQATAFPPGSAQRRDVFKTLVACSMTPAIPGAVIRVPDSLTRMQVRRLVIAYYRC